MCLDRKILKREKKYFQYEKHEGYSIGYKIYKGRKKNQITLTTTNYGKRQPVDQWINEKDVRDDHEDNSSLGYSFTRNFYPKGFHFYATLEAAKEYVNTRCWGEWQIRKVYFERACARGFQNKLPVVVAKNIYISKD